MGRVVVFIVLWKKIEVFVDWRVDSVSFGYTEMDWVSVITCERRSHLEGFCRLRKKCRDMILKKSVPSYQSRGKYNHFAQVFEKINQLEWVGFYGGETNTVHFAVQKLGVMAACSRNGICKSITPSKAGIPPLLTISRQDHYKPHTFGIYIFLAHKPPDLLEAIEPLSTTYWGQFQRLRAMSLQEPLRAMSPWHYNSMLCTYVSWRNHCW